MKKTLFAALFAVLSFSVLARPDLEGVTAAKYPDADYVTVEEIERVAYNPDGTSSSQSEAWIKILTEKGRREESSLSLAYSKRYGEAKILYVGAVGLDGKEREIDVSATTKESTDNSSMGANIYDPLDRMITCTIPGLKVGETVHVKIMRKTFKSRIKDHWADISVMEWRAPILKSVYEVKAPASRPIRSKAIRNPLGNVVEATRRLEDGSMLHVFTATNSPQMFPEPDMPPAYTQVQNIRLSTAAHWREISKWYWDLCLPHLEKTNYAMKEKVKKLKGDLKGEALVRSIFKFVSQEIRYMGLTMEDTSPGYAPHDVDITFDSRYGVCRDKAGLLVAMLRLAGLEAFPVLINVGAKMDKSVPQPYFNHAVAAVQLDPDKREYMLMDPTNENTKDIFPAYLSDKSYLVCREDGEELMTSPVPPSAQNAVIVKSSGKLSKDSSLCIESHISFLGINDTAYRGAFARMTHEKREQSFAKIVARLSPGAELISADIEPADMRDTEKPIKVKVIYRIPEAFMLCDTQGELFVPFVSKSLGIVNWLLEGSTSLERRKYPLVLDTTAEVNETVTIDISQGIGDVKFLPPEVKTGKGYDYSRSFKVKNGILEAKRRLAVSAVEFSPERYAELREEIKRVEATERKNVVFSVDDLEEADVEVLLNKSETYLAGDSANAARSWVTTNEVVKRVLTYSGKKDSSELKFTYNPSWKKIEILSATVSNVNGTVSRLSAKEINEMDAGWVASAPRYCAGKILVVNLPSVEIGSVISVKTAVTVKEAPTAFHSHYSFDSYSPLRRKSVTLDGWKREVVGPKRVLREPDQPDSRLWRDVVTVSKCDWPSAARMLEPAVKIGKVDLASVGLEDADIRQVRDWMARHIRVCGPSLYEIAPSRQITDPATVLKERYATRLDYVRTMAALLDAAGFDVDIVFAADDALKDPRLKKMDYEEYPDPKKFSAALCRVRFSEGGFFGIGAETKTIYIGTENEYTPLGTTPYDGCTFFDPLEVEFGTVTVAEERFGSILCEETQWDVRENGAVDIKASFRHYGSNIGTFRKRFAEILPEERDRLYQSLLGEIAQAATATGDLEADVESYPSTMSFKCFVPDYAVAEKGTLTLTLPEFACPLPVLAGNMRHTPLTTVSAENTDETLTVSFPEGYTKIEHLPKDLEEDIGGVRSVSSRIENGRLIVTITHKTRRSPARVYSSDRFSWLKEVRRRSRSRANRTIVVRRP